MVGGGEIKNPAGGAGVRLFSALFRERPLRPPDGLDPLHSFLHGGFREIRALLELLQHSRALVLLLEALNGAVDGFIVCNDDADQTKSPPSASTTETCSADYCPLSGSATTFSSSRRSPNLSNETTMARSPPEVRSLERTFPMPHSAWKMASPIVYEFCGR